MLVDHIAYVLLLSGHLPRGTLYTLCRAVGRPAFVLFCFLLVNGFDKTHDRKKYLARLIAFAVISQLPFSLAFTAANYRALDTALFSFDLTTALPLFFPLAVYFFTVCERRFDPSLLWLAAAFALRCIRLEVGGVCLIGNKLNVFYTLAAAMAVMMCLDYLLSEDRSLPRAFFVLAALALELYFVQQSADYGLPGVALIVGMFCLGHSRALQLGFAALWCIYEYRKKPPNFCGAVCALPLIALYNGKLGKKLRAFFYLLYPLHLLMLGILFILLSK